MAREEKAYARVIEKVKTMILSGELKPGEKLPPEREFAEKLEVSRNSVREAIRIMDMMKSTKMRSMSLNKPEMIKIR